MLPYTAEVLANLMGRLNAELWPLPLALVVLTLAAAAAAGWASGRARWLGVLLAAGWAWVAWIWFWRGMAPLDFLAPVYAAGFALQALLLLAFGVAGALELRPRPAALPGGADWVGLALVLLALTGLPALELLGGRAWAQVGTVWLAPTPSVVVTVGFVLLCRRPPLVLLLVPLLWALAAAGVGWVLGMSASLAGALLIGAGSAVALAVRLRPTAVFVN